MSALQIREMCNRLTALEEAVQHIHDRLGGIEGRLTALESSKIPAIEAEIAARFHQVAEEMHASVATTARVTCDAMRGDLQAEMRNFAVAAVVAHENARHPPRYAGVASEGSS
jgi:hypothetical protein